MNKRIINYTKTLLTLIRAKKLWIIFFALIIFTLFFNLLHNFIVESKDPIILTQYLLMTLFACLGLICLFAWRFTDLFPFLKRIISKNSNRNVSKLQNKIVTAFSLGAVIPTVIITLFSTYFFDYGVKSWFDKKVSTVLEQSMIAGESYVFEHTIQLKETAIAVSDDLSNMYYDLVHNPVLFNRVLNTMAELRSIDEAIVFQKDTNVILAQTDFSFGLTFSNISLALIEKAKRGQIVRLESDPTKIRILIKLQEQDDVFLVIGRVIDAKIIDHIDKTKGTASEYFKLRDKISAMQMQFMLVFIVLTLILIFAAIIWGQRFAKKLVKPIIALVVAADEVKKGNYSTQLNAANLNKDEVKLLSISFNRMVRQIDRQQKELLVAQRALAWSDVARKVAHEIKNPLTPIQLSTERLIKKFQHQVDDPDSFAKYAQNILRNSLDIKRIVAEFVAFARLPEANFSNVDIVEMVANFIAERQLINNDIIYNFKCSVPKYQLVCDINQMRQVIENILQNAEYALKNFFNRAKKIINISIECTNNELVITIEDNGPGFDGEIISQAKKAYVTSKKEGTGLGLAIVERIVTEHFGQIELSNVKPHGARVVLTFQVNNLKFKLKK